MNIRKLFIFASVYSAVCLWVVCLSVVCLSVVCRSAIAQDAEPGESANFDPLALPAANIQVPNYLDNAFNDDRRQRTTSKAFPFSAVGKLQNADGSYCTATLISKDIIVTASHCIMSDEGGELVQGHYVFTPLYGNGSRVSAGVSYFWWGTKYPNQNRESDWALLRLDRTLGDQFGYLGVQSFGNAATLLGKAIIWMSSYSSDFKNGAVASYEKGCSFTRFVGGMYHHNCDSARGSSGASMFYFQKPGDVKTAYVVAVHVAEFRDGGNTSLTGIPYSDDHSNISIPASAFYPTFLSIK